MSFRIPEFIQVLQTHECFLHHLRSRVNVPSTDRDAGMPGDLLNRERVRPISTFVVFQLYDKELFAVVATLAPSMKSCMSFKAAGAFSDAAIWTVYRPVIVQGRSIRESSSPTAACSVRTNVCRSTYPEFQEQESHCGSDCGHRSDHRPRPIHFSDREPRQVFPKSVYRAVTQCGALTFS